MLNMRITAISALLILAGCAQQAEESGQSANVAGVQAPSEVRPLPQKSEAPSPSSYLEEETSTANETAKTKDPSETAPAITFEALAAIDVSLDQFKGKNFAEISQILGAPDLLKKDGKAEVWQYQNHRDHRLSPTSDDPRLEDMACILDLYFYQDDGADAPFRVTFAEARAGRLGEAFENHCLAWLIMRVQKTA